MMKVNPFSYHIPRRKAYVIVSPYSGGNYSLTHISPKPSHTLPPSNSCLRGIGTVLILVLLGFVGVTGQGKISDMDESSTFSPQSHLRANSLSHKNLDSLPTLESLDVDDDDEDEVLQRRISSIGHYGTKYRNDSFSYNYSSHPPSSTSLFSDDQKYKLDHIGDVLITPDESLLSLHDQRSGANKSGETDGNTISQQSIIFPMDKRKGGKGKRDRNYVDDVHPRDTWSKRNLGPTSEVTTLNETTGTFLNVTYYPRGSRTKTGTRNDFKHYKEDIIGLKDEPEDGNLFSSHFSEEKTDYDDEYDEDDILERFIPGNSSHLSGKQRFRQGSQAEVDGAASKSEGDGNSLLSTPSSRRRPRRSVVHLYDMVVCSTGCNPLIFKGYGCYCGFLGSGLTVDGIDKCCAKHDWCYHHAKCPPLLTYFVPYYWRCDHGRPQCVTDFRGWKGVCGAHLCECDRQFAECLKKFPCPRSRAMCVTSPWRFWQNLLMTPSMRYRY